MARLVCLVMVNPTNTPAPAIYYHILCAQLLLRTKHFDCLSRPAAVDDACCCLPRTYDVQAAFELLLCLFIHPLHQANLIESENPFSTSMSCVECNCARSIEPFWCIVMLSLSFSPASISSTTRTDERTKVEIEITLNGI